jgi:hypothetical protein
VVELIDWASIYDGEFDTSIFSFITLMTKGTLNAFMIAMTLNGCLL